MARHRRRRTATEGGPRVFLPDIFEEPRSGNIYGQTKSLSTRLPDMIQDRPGGQTSASVN